jgi:integrase
MTSPKGSVGWTLEHHDFGRDPLTLAGIPEAASLDTLARRNEAVDGTPVLVGPNGHVDTMLLRYLRCRKFKKLAATSQERYIQSLRLWLNFLEKIDLTWESADFDAIAAFKEWRITDRRNSRRVSQGSWATDKAALTHFYKHVEIDPVHRRALGIEDLERVDEQRADGVDDLLRDGLSPGGQNVSNVRWLTPAAYEQWRNMGIRGFGLDNVPREGLGLRFEDRNHAFADGIFGSGCRRVEWSSLLTIELPVPEQGRRYHRLILGQKVVKGDRSYRKVLIERQDLRRIHTYMDDGSRRESVERGQRSGVYDRVPGRIDVLDYRPMTREVQTGARTWVSLDHMTLKERQRMFVEGPHGWEPLWLWLGASGEPLTLKRWNSIFNEATGRMAKTLAKARVVADPLWCTPHMLRHSFAFKWFCFFESTYHLRLQHLTEDERRDYRAQFGDTWFLIATLLRHTDPNTTRRYYLAPFQEVHVDAMLALIDPEERALLTDRLSAVAEQDPRVHAALDLVRPGREGMDA